MGLLQTIEDNYKAAFRGGDKITTSVLRVLKTALQNEEIAKRGKTGQREVQLTEEEVLAVVKRQVKQLEEAGELFVQGGRPDLKDKNDTELTILQRYLPAAISEEEVRKTVKRVIEGIAGREGKAGLQFGKVMGAVMKELKDQADGILVSRVVKGMLGT